MQGGNGGGGDGGDGGGGNGDGGGGGDGGDGGDGGGGDIVWQGVQSLAQGPGMQIVWLTPLAISRFWHALRCSVLADAPFRKESQAQVPVSAALPHVWAHFFICRREKCHR